MVLSMNIDAGEQTDRRGTVWDWPAGWIFVGVLLFLVSAVNGAPVGMLISLVLATFGGVTLMARRGSFTPRR